MGLGAAVIIVWPGRRVFLLGLLVLDALLGGGRAALAEGLTEVVHTITQDVWTVRADTFRKELEAQREIESGRKMDTSKMKMNLDLLFIYYNKYVLIKMK